MKIEGVITAMIYECPFSMSPLFRKMFPINYKKRLVLYRSARIEMKTSISESMYRGLIRTRKFIILMKDLIPKTHFGKQ